MSIAEQPGNLGGMFLFVAGDQLDETGNIPATAHGVNYILTTDAGGPLRSLKLQIGAKQ